MRIRSCPLRARSRCPCRRARSQRCGQPVNVSAELTSSVGTPSGPIVISDGAGASCQIVGAIGNCNLIPNNAWRSEPAGELCRQRHPSRQQCRARASGRSSCGDRAHRWCAVSAVDASVPGTPVRAPRFLIAVQVVAPGAGGRYRNDHRAGAGRHRGLRHHAPGALACELVPQSFGVRNFGVSYTGDSRYLPSNTVLELNVLPDRLFRTAWRTRGAVASAPNPPAWIRSSVSGAPALIQS